MAHIQRIPGGTGARSSSPGEQEHGWLYTLVVSLILGGIFGGLIFGAGLYLYQTGDTDPGLKIMVTGAVTCVSIIVFVQYTFGQSEERRRMREEGRT